MKVSFWKLSQSSIEFNFNEVVESIGEKLAYVHKDTGPKGNNTFTQAEAFVNAQIGDYFYLTHGNDTVLLLGQFTGPANIYSKFEDWIDRPYRVIRYCNIQKSYSGPNKWWTPNHRSTFVEVPEDEFMQFEELILEPYFELELVKLNF